MRVRCVQREWSLRAAPVSQRLLDGTRATINPALQELRDRILGEYVEAPTWIPDDSVHASGHAPAPAREAPREAREAGEPPLPGQR